MKVSELFEIAAKGEGRYGSARDINAKLTACVGCGKRIEKATAFNGGVGKHLCKTCKEKKSE